MPDWKVHLIFGLLLLVLWLSIIYSFSLMVLNPQKLLVLILLMPFISIFPDIDSKQSKSRRVLSLLVSISISLIYILIFPGTWYYGIAYFFILYFLIILFPTRHRGITHSLLFSLIFSSIITFLLYLALNFVEIEFISWFSLILFTYSLHLALDRL